MPDAPPAETGPPVPASAPATALPVEPAPVPAAQVADPAELATLREQAAQLTDQAQAAQQRAETAELDLARLTVIRAAQLPDALAVRLTGTTEAELTSDAAALSEVITALITAATPTAPLTTGRPPVEALRPAASAPADPVEDSPEQITRLVWGK